MPEEVTARIKISRQDEYVLSSWFMSEGGREWAQRGWREMGQERSLKVLESLEWAWLGFTR